MAKLSTRIPVSLTITLTRDGKTFDPHTGKPDDHIDPDWQNYLPAFLTQSKSAGRSPLRRKGTWATSYSLMGG
jgi:hypothetical protein